MPGSSSGRDSDVSYLAEQGKRIIAASDHDIVNELAAKFFGQPRPIPGLPSSRPPTQSGKRPRLRAPVCDLGDSQAEERT